MPENNNEPLNKGFTILRACLKFDRFHKNPKNLYFD